MKNKLLLYANLTKLIGSLCWTKKVSFFPQSKPIFNQFLLVKRSNTACSFELRLQIGFYDQNLVRKKEDFEIKSDLFWQNTFLKLWKLKFIIIQFGSVRFWSIFLCFCVRYKVCIVHSAKLKNLALTKRTLISNLI